MPKTPFAASRVSPTRADAVAEDPPADGTDGDVHDVLQQDLLGVVIAGPPPTLTCIERRRSRPGSDTRCRGPRRRRSSPPAAGPSCTAPSTRCGPRAPRGAPPSTARIKAVGDHGRRRQSQKASASASKPGKRRETHFTWPPFSRRRRRVDVNASGAVPCGAGYPSRAVQCGLERPCVHPCFRSRTVMHRYEADPGECSRRINNLI